MLLLSCASGASSERAICFPESMNGNSSRTRWCLVGLIFLTYALMFVDRINISIAAGPIMHEFRLSSIQMGWVFSAFVLGYAALQVPGGWLSDRFGPERVLGVSIILWSAFTAMTAAASKARE